MPACAVLHRLCAFVASIRNQRAFSHIPPCLADVARAVESVDTKIDKVVEKMAKLEQGSTMAQFGGMMPQMESQVNESK